MKLLIAGGRDFDNFNLLERTLLDTFKIDDIEEIISGGAKGADNLGLKFAEKQNIKYKIFYPQWDLFGKRAGFIRNSQMVALADFLLAFWDGKSKGTAHTIKLARDKGIPTMTIHYDKGQNL